MTTIENEAEDNLKKFVDNFTERAAVLFHILQKTTHKSCYNINGDYVVVTIQRKVYSEGTSKPSPTRKDVKKKPDCGCYGKDRQDPDGYQGGLADGKF